ncbi:MAG: retropepsin-like aspartic protease [Fimbriimonas sp.]|nr:retropepsin-like aspartic protease [Fimbriimonas sp.]
MTSLLLAALFAVKVTTPDVVENVRQAIHNSANQAWTETLLSGRATFNGVEGRYALQFQPGGPFVQTIQGALGQTFGSDGKEFWQIDRTGASRRLAFEDVDRTEAVILLLTDRWIDPASRVNATLEKPEPDRKMYRIRIKPIGTGLEEHITIDPETWLPTSAEFEIASSKTVVELSDWRTAGDVKIPCVAKVTNEGLTDEFRVDTLKPVSQPDDATYSPHDNTPADRTYDTSKPAQLETKRAASGHVMVHPLVNGNDIGWFILDSGAESMVIDSAAADSLNLAKVGKEAVVGVGGAVQEPFRMADTFTLGPATMRNVSFVEIDLHGLGDIFKVKIAGIVGYDFFRRFTVLLNLKKPLVEVKDSDTYRLPDGAWTKILFSTGNPAVVASFEGDRQDWFRLDTGASGAVTFHAPAVARLHLLDKRQTTPASMAGVGGQTEARVGRLAWFELGGHRFEKVDATFSLAKTGAFADRYLAGNIGQDLMEPFTVVFDFGGSRVAFLPN